MRAVVQRVLEASVQVDNKNIGKIDRGFLVFLGVGQVDNEEDVDYMVRKILGLRVFEDDAGKMNRSLMDIGGDLLVISQFTLYGDVRKGKRPSFGSAAAPELGEKLYLDFITEARKQGLKVETGLFGADMKVSLVNDGPVTIQIDSKKLY